MSCVKSFAKDWFSRVVLRMLKGFRIGGAKFEGNYKSWEAAAANGVKPLVNEIPSSSMSLSTTGQLLLA